MAELLLCIIVHYMWGNMSMSMYSSCRADWCFRPKLTVLMAHEGRANGPK